MTTATTTSQNSHKGTLKDGLLKAARTTTQTPSTFSRWRPSYHLIAPYGWLNDPCAPGFIPSTGRYHVGFQWNPKGAEWGDVVWGKAFSSDLVSWDVSETPSLERDQPYDHAGVFTGCWRPTGLDGKGAEDKGEVSFVYTSVSRLPIHYTKSYHRGCETLSLATSQDGGATWVKHAHNAILPGPPEGVDALGWRDPYVAAWPAMARMLQVEDQKALFGLVTGGIRDKTPTTWVYKIDADDLTKWEFAGPLVKTGKNFAPSRWTGDVGINWEVTNFVSLASEDAKHHQDFLIFGAEGCQAPYGGAGTVPGTKRTNRAQLWIAIDPNEEATAPALQPLSSTNGGQSSPEQSALMKFSYGGVFDHGLHYAANGFWDPATQQQVVVGWVTEEDIPVSLQVKQKWSGCLSLPRVASLVTLGGVVRASQSGLDDISSIRATPDGQGSCTVQTLGIKPDARLQKLRAGAKASSLAARALAGSAELAVHTAQWEAVAEFANVGGAGCDKVGMQIRHAAGATTTLYFAPKEETFVIERPDIYFEDAGALASEPGWTAALQNETAPHTLFTTAATGEERLRVHVFYDGSVLEVFVNERVAITTRVYLEAQQCAALRFFAAGSEGVVLEQAAVWDGLSAP